MSKKTRAQRLKAAGLYEEFMWHEKYMEDYEGHFLHERKQLETETTEQVFDRWCRGQNLSGFAYLIIRRLKFIQKITT